MSKVKYLFVVLILTAVITSCDQELSFLAKMSANIGGEDWTTLTRVTTKQNDTFIITGTASDGKTIVITINGSDVKSYELDPLNSKTEFGALYKETVEVSDDDAYLAKSGIVDITEIDETNNRISGYFEFEVFNLDTTILITDGKFEDLKYTSSNN